MVTHMIGARNNINTLLLIRLRQINELTRLAGITRRAGAGEIIAHCHDTNSP